MDCMLTVHVDRKMNVISYICSQILHTMMVVGVNNKVPQDVGHIVADTVAGKRRRDTVNGKYLKLILSFLAKFLMDFSEEMWCM